MPQRILIVALALLSLGLGIFAFRQSNARLEAENQLRALEAKITQAAKAQPAPATVVPTRSTPPTLPPVESDAHGPNAEQLARTDTPEMQRLMNLRTRSALDTQYAGLFKYLALPPDQLEKLQQLLQDRRNIFRDVTIAMRNQGLAPVPENADKIQALVNNAATENDNQVRAVLGAETYAKYRNFEVTLPQRQSADRVQQRLSYTTEPLTDPQYSQLVDLIVQGNLPTSSGPTASDAGIPRRRGNAIDTSAITPAIINQARAFLSPAQLVAVEQIQAEQEASAQLSRVESGR